MDDFWSTIDSTKFSNEATVETRLILPLLAALGYDNFDISPKHPILFQEGRKVGRRPEADFVVFYGPIQDRQTSLIVVEAKAPGESFSAAKAQAESYAFNIRAPFCILSDGVDFEVWQFQPSQESERIIGISVASLSSNRGAIENLLSKEATLHYCKSLPHKTLVQASSDVSSYISCELRRISTNEQAISRRLVGNTLSSAEEVETTTLLEKTDGAIITGPSGYGKSTLARHLYSSALSQSWSSGTSALPFDVPLPEFVECGQRLIEYLHDRISSHCPAISIRRLEDWLREHGAILVCDGFDRISVAERPSVETSLRTILRDFPNIRLYVFSRENSKPNLPLPTLRLEELTLEQQQEIRLLATAVSNCPEVMWNLPRVLQKLCSHPLLLNLIINHLVRHRSVPSGIGDLFESWLASVLPSQTSGPASAVDREDALSLLVAEAVEKPLTKSRAVALLVRQGFPRQIFDELVSHDAIVVTGMTVEVQHESLADYMRARSIVSLPMVDMQNTLLSVPLRVDSMFPILLMALLPSRAMQRLVWERLTRLDLSTYLDALRFHADVSSDISDGTRDDTAKICLEDVLDGIMQPLDAFFSPLTPPAMETLAGERCTDLAILGTVSVTPANLTYQIRARADGGDERVRVGMPNDHDIYGLSFIDLELTGLRLDSGRIVGAGLLFSALREVVSARKLQGGRVFTNELVAGRLRLLEERFDHDVDWETLASIEAGLLSIANQEVRPMPFRERWPRFGIAELIDDVRKLRQFGAPTVERWWKASGELNDHRETGQDEIRYLLDEHYRRLQLAYSEAASLSFGKLVHKLRIFPLLPVRWDLTLVQHPATRRYTVYPRWVPVIDWSDAGADVTFSERPPILDLEAEWPDLVSRLSSLGRPTDRGMAYGGFRQLPSFDGNQLNGSFDGETSVMYEVAEILDDEIKDLFTELPHSTYGI